MKYATVITLPSSPILYYLCLVFNLTSKSVNMSSRIVFPLLTTALIIQVQDYDPPLYKKLVGGYHAMLLTLKLVSKQLFKMLFSDLSLLVLTTCCTWVSFLFASFELHDFLTFHLVVEHRRLLLRRIYSRACPVGSSTDLKALVYMLIISKNDKSRFSCPLDEVLSHKKLTHPTVSKYETANNCVTVDLEERSLPTLPEALALLSFSL